MTADRRTILQAGIGAVAASSLSALAAHAAAPKARTPLKILILGGTGFIGPNQVRYALERGHQVTIFNRGRQPKEWPGQVEELLGDRNTGDLKSLEGREWDVCIDNPTTLPFWVRDAGAVLKGKVKHYIFVSTISVYASGAKPADETDAVAPYTGPDAFAERKVTNELYGPLKAVSEAEARKQFGAAAAIVRPGLIVGPGDPTDRFTYWPVRLARGGEVLAPGNGADHVQFIDARDLAEWMIRLAESRATGDFNALGPARPLTMKPMLEGIAKGVGGSAKLTWAPTEFLDAQNVSAWGDMPVWVPEGPDTAGFSRRSNARAMKAGLTFRPLETTAADTLAWFRTQPDDRQAKLRAGLTPEREAEVLAKLKAKG